MSTNNIAKWKAFLVMGLVALAIVAYALSESSVVSAAAGRGWTVVAVIALLSVVAVFVYAFIRYPGRKK